LRGGKRTSGGGGGKGEHCMRLASTIPKTSVELLQLLVIKLPLVCVADGKLHPPLTAPFLPLLPAIPTCPFRLVRTI